jgi:hypothetical protein
LLTPGHTREPAFPRTARDVTASGQPTAPLTPPRTPLPDPTGTVVVQRAPYRRTQSKLDPFVFASLGSGRRYGPEGFMRSEYSQPFSRPPGDVPRRSISTSSGRRVRRLSSALSASPRTPAVPGRIRPGTVAEPTDGSEAGSQTIFRMCVGSAVVPARVLSRRETESVRLPWHRNSKSCTASGTRRPAAARTHQRPTRPPIEPSPQPGSPSQEKLFNRRSETRPAPPSCAVHAR